MSDFTALLDKYAELAVKVGVNIQQGQTLVVHAPVESADFTRSIAAKAYEAGARLVKVYWNDEALTRMQYEHASDDVFTEQPKWFAGEITELVENGAAVLHILAENPDLLKGIDAERIANYYKTRGEALKQYRAYQQADKFSWCLIAVPSPAWAAKVFPEAPDAEQMERLWKAIFHTVRIDQEAPVEAWKQHLDVLNQKSTVLNAKQYKALHYTAPGTDLTIELPKGHIWAQGDSINEQGHTFVANMPTEEVFTAPLKSGVHGKVSSTKPLSYAGNIINHFSLTFEEGKVVSFTAEEGYETLGRLLNMDEGARYLGEVALVPHQSPISESGILYFNTLFDENASNHLAIGSAYAFCLEGGKQMSQEELTEAGLNTSVTHVDFMIGSADMNIDGITHDGRKEPVFRNGNWAF
ncbi:aminopeptidase [Paenibacillus sp. F411]|uniref:aminopeptidase n=1 Tax=Paenibacillus sp. F411 TaxID=2820239 RepID=UPI001AAE3457|nr:aminopeptidase [Paenibacillus sp. F411]MBO2942950.1 aminopeptidase [Paenibacillus sp. F411]